MTNVVPIKPTIERKDAREPVPEIIDLLECMLERAKQGRLRSIALACEEISPGEHAPGIATTWTRGEGGSTFVLVGGVSHLLHRLHASIENS